MEEDCVKFVYHYEKCQPNLEGPFVIKEAYLRNAYKLVNVDEDELGHLWNGLYLKKIYP